MAGRLLAELADRIAGRLGSGILRVAVDGVDGAGKTTFADRLGDMLRRGGIGVIRAGIDGFHHPRATRYRLGRGSPEGFFRDSFDLAGFRQHLLDPLGPGGSLRFRRAVFDHRQDAALDGPEETAVPPAVLLVDGIFLQRDELRPHWDLTIFLDVPFAESFRRMARRDGGDPDPDAAGNRRYREGQELYFAQCDPRSRADVLIDCADLERLVIMRG